MENKAKINFKLFQRRKRFSIKRWLLNNKTATFKDFIAFLGDRQVLPPSEDFFNKARDQFLPSQQEVKVIPVLKEKIINAESEEVVEKPVEVVQEEVKPKRKRQRKKVEEKDNVKKDNDE